MDTESFFNVCYANDLKSAQALLIKGISPNVQNNEGITPLQIAASNGYLDLANLLLENNALVDLSNNYGWTPLMHAARHGNTAIVSLLLKRKAKVNICNKFGLRPIVAAAWSGQLSTIKLLIDAGAVVNHMPSQSKHSQDCDLSALMAASIQGHDSALRFLLEKDAVVNQASSVTGLTPLMLSACNGHKQVVQIIVEWGGDANRMDICGRTALDIATVRSKLEVKAYLENMTHAKLNSDQSSDKNIFQAVRVGNNIEVLSILQHDPHLANITDSCDGSTPLMIAAMLGHLNIAQMLVLNGANLDFQDSSNGWPAIMHAVFHRQEEIISFLVEAGANIGVQSLNGYTAIDLARHLDGSETNIINALTQNPRTTQSYETSRNLSASSQLENRSSTGKPILSDTCSPKKSQQSARLKEWIGGVSQKFQQRMFSRNSTRASTAMPLAPEIFISDSSCEDVFLEPGSFQDATATESHLNISTLLSPNKRLSSSLRKQSVEAISPPLLSSPNCDEDLMKKFSPINLCDKSLKKPIISLRTPNLLKAYNRKNSKGNKSDSSFPVDAFKRAPSKSEKGHLSSNLEAHAVEKTVQKMYGADSIPASGDLTQLLNQKSLQKYAEKFREQEIDIEAFKCLAEEDLKELGIESFNSQEKLLDMIKHMQRK